MRMREVLAKKDRPERQLHDWQMVYEAVEALGAGRALEVTLKDTGKARRLYLAARRKYDGSHYAVSKTGRRVTITPRAAAPPQYGDAEVELREVAASVPA